MAAIDYLAVIEQESARLSAAAEDAGPDAVVPTCPEWRVGDLLKHITVIFTRVELTVRTKAQERIGVEALPTPLPSLGEATASLAETLAAANPDEPVWNWTVSRPKVAGYWPRRMAHEVVVHRVDAELALGGVDAVTPVDPAVALDGIEELFDSFLPAVVTWYPDRSLGGSMHVHATDAEGEWLVSFGDGEADVRHEHAKGDAAVRGGASDLLLLLWNRLSLDDGAVAGRFEVFGDRAVLDRWRDLRI